MYSKKNINFSNAEWMILKKEKTPELEKHPLYIDL